MKKTGTIDRKQRVVLIDFDNTITTFDVLDDMLARFSKDAAWVDLEKRWKAGKIGSRQCLDGQVRGVRITERRLDKYLSSVRIDPHFKKLVGLLDDANVRTIILSDNFDHILTRILHHNGVCGITTYANRLTFRGDRLIPSFPFANPKCGSCANCKTSTVKKNKGKGTMIVYVGDGLSDTCAAGYADVVFAKDALLDHCVRNKIDCIPYRGLDEVYAYFKRSMR